MASVFLNGQIIDEADAHISVNDRGLLLGDGLFETMRAYGGEVFRLSTHLARLRHSAEFLRLRFPHSDDEMQKRIGELIRLNECPNAYVRLTVTRGCEVPGLRMGGDGAPTVMACARPVAEYPKELYKSGMRLVVSAVRQNSASPLPRHKTLNYLPYLLARQDATDVGAQGAILLNEHGQLTEESVSNVFMVCDGHLVTPPVHCGLLPGVTRAVVMELAAEADIRVEERPVAPDEMFACDEMFLTNTLMEIMPVRMIDKRALHGKAPGPVTSRLREMYHALVARETG